MVCGDIFSFVSTGGCSQASKWRSPGWTQKRNTFFWWMSCQRTTTDINSPITNGPWVVLLRVKELRVQVIVYLVNYISDINFYSHWVTWLLENFQSRLSISLLLSLSISCNHLLVLNTAFSNIPYKTEQIINWCHTYSYLN